MSKRSRREFMAGASAAMGMAGMPAPGVQNRPADQGIVSPGRGPGAQSLIREGHSVAKRPLREVTLEADLAVAGGSLSGTCTALTAARAGIKVVIVHDRPVLGGNASSEVRLWILGATAHMHNNNRWAREGGVLDEICVENMHRNPEGNPVVVDTILLEKVMEEPNITLLLNTAVYDVEKDGPDHIASLRAYCSQNETEYVVKAPLFCDASGDGVLAFRAGAAFRMGAETRGEFGEQWTPTPEYGYLLGHSMYFYSRDAGRPVRYVAPSFALKDIRKLPKWQQLTPQLNGCRLWWLEWGGRLDTVHETEDIKWELWRAVYGVWDYLKNSGKFPEAANLTLEWVSMIPGKRESRRFEGDYMLRQQDVIGQRTHADAVSYGGWSIDLHPADGLYSKFPSCSQYHSKGIYQIPYRCLYSRNISNLFLTGRIISVSHVAFGSTRVMGTCSNSGQAVGMAAALCRRDNKLPRDLIAPERMKVLQRELAKAGQYIPGFRLDDPDDLAPKARISASSYLKLARLTAGDRSLRLEHSWAMLLPVSAGRMPAVAFTVEATEATTVTAELRASSRSGNYTPDRTLATRKIELRPGTGQIVNCVFDVALDRPQYVFICLMRNPAVSVKLSDRLLTGVMACYHRAKGAVQNPPPDSGIESFEFWYPDRRPECRNLALSIDPPLNVFRPENVINGVARPTVQPNAWVADFEDAHPQLTLEWDRPRTVREIVLGFDTDFDHPMESVLMGHREADMPFCVKRYRILDEAGRVVYHSGENHQTRNRIRLEKAVVTRSLHLEIQETHGAPAAVFEVRCYT